MIMATAKDSDAAGVDQRELAQQLFREFYAQCFWHWKPDLQVTDDVVPRIIDGLKRHGGRKGLLAAAQLAGEKTPKAGRNGESLRLDWCFDSAFRFFPVQSDPDFGYCLHRADLATNKVLALAGRQEIRDFLDIMYLHQTYLSLGAICWAASGKDEGFTPWSLLEMARRHVKFRNGDLESGNLDQEHLARPLSLLDLKQQWQEAVAQAEQWFAKLPSGEAGCLYLAASGEPFTPDPQSPEYVKTVRHIGSVRGAWPQIS